jgi:transcription elongation factor GreB
VKLVGVDEADMTAAKINWLSPVAQALMKKRVGDTAKIRLEDKVEMIEVIDIRYVLPDAP